MADAATDNKRLLRGCASTLFVAVLAASSCSTSDEPFARTGTSPIEVTSPATIAEVDGGAQRDGGPDTAEPPPTTVPTALERDPDTGDPVGTPPLLPDDKQQLIVAAVADDADCTDVDPEPLPEPAAGFVSIQAGRIVDGCLVYTTEQVPVEGAAAQIDKLSADPDVVAAGPATRPLLDRSPAPAVDPLVPDQWWLRDLDVDELDQLSVYRTTPVVRVAVIDGDIDETHTDLRHLVVGLAPWPSDPSPDDASHATHVAGVIAAVADNGTAGRGLARHVQLLDVPFGPSTAEMITWAVDHGAQIINMSFCETEWFDDPASDGGGWRCDSDPNGATAAAVAYAREHGVMLFASAGNCGPTTGGRSTQCGYEVNRKQYPSSYSSVIAVAAYDRRGDVAGFSTRGFDVDVAAPGVDIVSIVADQRSGPLDGTSMAVPMVSGAAAVLLAHRPDVNPGRIYSGLFGITRDAGPSGWDADFGSGKIWPTEVARRLDAATPIPSEPPPDPFPLYQGQEGQVDLITALQTALSAAGYYLGAVDGEFGPRTTAAVEAFQTDEGMTVTRQVDRPLFDLATLRASQAPPCEPGLLSAAAEPLEEYWRWYDVPSCEPGWALYGNFLPDTAAGGWALFRVRGDQWVEVSASFSREAGIWLGAGTQLGERGFAELWGRPGWPYRVSSGDDVARYVFDDVTSDAGTLPGAWELVGMWLDSSSTQLWIDRLYGEYGSTEGALQSCTRPTGDGGPWQCVFASSDGPDWLLVVSGDLRSARLSIVEEQATLIDSCEGLYTGIVFDTIPEANGLAAAAVCSWPYALIPWNTTTAGTRVSLIVQQGVTANGWPAGQILGTWSGFESDDGTSRYDAAAFVALGVPADVAQALHDELGWRQVGR